MKLGQKVKFKKHLRKLDRYEENMANIKYKTIELDEPLEGYISGKRTIPYKGYTDNEKGFYYFVPKDYRDIILVAVNWNGFYRVPEKWLEVVDNE